MAVVHLFEMIHIQHGQRHRLVQLFALHQLRGHHLIAPCTVAKTREGIRLGQVPVASLCSLSRPQTIEIAPEMVSLDAHQIQTQQMTALHQLHQHRLGHRKHRRVGCRQHKSRRRTAVDQRNFADAVTCNDLTDGFGITPRHTNVQCAVEQHIQVLVELTGLQQNATRRQNQA